MIEGECCYAKPVMGPTNYVVMSNIKVMIFFRLPSTVPVCNDGVGDGSTNV